MRSYYDENKNKIKDIFYINEIRVIYNPDYIDFEYFAGE